MKIPAHQLEPSFSDSIRQLPPELQSSAVALNFEKAPPDLQQQFVETIHDKLKSSCDSTEKKATEELFAQVLARADATVTRQAAEQLDHEYNDLLQQVEPVLLAKLESKRRLQQVIRNSTASNQARPSTKLSVSKPRSKKMSVAPSEIVAAVAQLDKGEGVTNAQVKDHCDLTRPQASKLLTQCVKDKLLESTKRQPGRTTFYWLPKGEPPTRPSKPEPVAAPQPSLDNSNNKGSRYQRGLFSTESDTPGVISNHYKVSMGKQCNPNDSLDSNHKIIDTIKSQTDFSSSNTELASAIRFHISDKRADQISACGTPKPYEADDGTIYPNHDRCKHRLCALCVDKRKLKRFRLDGHLIVDGLEYMFITAVHENIDTITSDSVDSLRKAANAFLDSKAMSWATGGIGSLEFGYEGSKELPWRLHIHLLIPIVEPFTNIRAVKDAMHATWRRHSVDDMHIAVESNNYDIDRRLKYVGKGNDNPDIPADQLEALYLATENRQLINKFGSWLKSPQIKPLTSGGNNPAQVSPTIDEQVIEQVERQLGTGDNE
jgi:hypothetical protein